MSPTWFHAVADRLNDSVMLLSPIGVVVACNPPASRAIPRAIEGTSLVEQAADPAAFSRYLALASRTSHPLPGVVRFTGMDGRWRCDAAATIVRGQAFVILQLRSAEETVGRFVALNEKIEQLQAEIRHRKVVEHERALLLQSEQQARAAAEQANRFKDELLASISHELRTPLNAISGWIALIRDDPGDRERLMRGLDVIERNLRAEARLTEDLVDSSLVITGRMRLDLQTVELERIIREAIESIRPSIDAKAQRVDFTVESACVINGDPARLLQVIWNLLSNATKYTPREGTIRIVLRRIESHAEIVVNDTGEGIATDVLPYVFDRFRRADQSTTRRHGGLGLGLAIVRHLVELHGGVVIADSRGHGSGTTMTVNLPLPVFHGHSAAVPDALAGVDGGRDLLAGLRILLVEDHEDSREILCNILAAQRAEVTAVASSSCAQEAFRQRRFDVIVSDVEMPDEDGFTLMRKLRVIERELGQAPVPTIAVSAHSIGDARLHALRAGYQAFLAKPMRPAELVALVASLCQQRRV